MNIKAWFENTFYNDVGQTYIYIIMFGLGLAVLGTCIYFHELGHWIWFKLQLKKNVKIRFVYENWHSIRWETGVQEDYYGLTDQQYKDMLLCGVALGLVPILLAMLIWLPFWLMIFPYLAGIYKEFKVSISYDDEKEKPAN